MKLLTSLLLLAISATAQISPDSYRSLHWRSIGTYRAGRISAVAGVPSQPEIFYVGTNSDLFCNTQTEADGLLWDGQEAFPGNSAQQIAAALNQNGVLEIFYVGTNNDLYHNMQAAPGSDTWVGETNFPGDSAQQVA